MNAPMETPVELRLPPHSIEAEQSLLGGLMLDARAWDIIAERVTDADFYRDDHRRIFRHIRLLAETGKPTDVVSVFDGIERANEVDQVGGLGYLGEIANNTPGAANIKRYAEIVRERAKLRRVLAIGDGLASECFNPGIRTAATLIEEVEQKLAAELDGGTDEPASLYDAFRETLAYVDGRSETSGLKTHFHEFDAMTGGLEPGDLVVVAARPSVGKTLFGCNVADHVATNGGACGFFTLEMSRRQIAMRIMAARTSVSMHAMRSGNLANDAFTRMSDAVPKSVNQRLWIDDKSGIGVPYVRARAKRMKRKHGLDLLVIDYLGLMKGTGDNRTQEIGSISRDLKALAKELCIPIIVLAQLNRGVEARTDKRPMMSDLRDSGEIEQDADIIAMLHREELYTAGPEWKGFAELIVRKNRNGPLGDVALTYDGAHMIFAPWHGDSPRNLVAANQYRSKSKGFREE